MRKTQLLSTVLAISLGLSGCATGEAGQQTAKNVISPCIDWDVNSDGFASVSVTNWEGVECALNNLAAGGFMAAEDVSPIVEDIKDRYSKVKTDPVFGYFSAISGDVSLQGNVTYDDLIYISDFNIITSD